MLQRSLACTATLVGIVVLIVPKTHAAVTVTPTTFTLAAGQSLSLAVAGAGTQGVTWGNSPLVGSLSGSSTSAVYTAPASVLKNQTVQISATTIATPLTTVKATITLVPAITVTVAPSSADVMSNNQQSFTATVTGSTNTAVTWSASLGSISASGVYTAPTVNSDTTDTVTATSQANPAVSATATVRLHSKTGIWFQTGSNGLQGLYFKGLNYNYLYGEGLVTAVTTTTSTGNSRVTPVCSSTVTVNSVSKHCTTTGADTVDVTVTFSTPAASPSVSTAPGTSVGTVQADVSIRNNSATDTIAQAQLSILGVSMTQFNSAASHTLGIDSANPVSYGNFVTGQFAVWNNGPTPDVSMGLACGWTYVCKNQPFLNTIAPGQTKTASFSLRFTDDTAATSINLAPEAFTAFANAYPSVVNWPDRRPIMAWFIADHSHQSTTNPRGYLFDPTVDVSNIPAFTSKVMAQAQSILSEIQSRPVQPQGLIIWDLEGEEFVQATTYVGDPRVFDQGYAPEMQATADGVFALFKNAGLKVGITLRPQSVQWGTVVPTQCNYNSDNNYKDYFIKVDAALGQKFYYCTAPNTWSISASGNGGQTFYTSSQVQQVTNLLLAKAQYAHQRWGATLFYVDTSVWVGGAPLPQDVFRALQLALPDSLFIPEENYAATMGVAMPFSDPKNSLAPKYAPPSWRYIYPTGALGIYLSNCVSTCWTTNLPSFDIGQKVGDIPLYTAPPPFGTVNAQYLAIESMIQQARSEAGSITVTDSTTGTQYSYSGSPATVYQYPLKMRVYFAADATSMPASTTYCESGQWHGENTCTLDLTGLVTAQIRYYDFNNQLVITGSPQPR